MRIAIFVVAIASFSATAVLAHHKSGHHTPPGQLKKQPAVIVLEQPEAPELEVELSSDLEWRHHHNAAHGFDLDLPVGRFAREEIDGSRLVLFDDETGAEIQVFGGLNQQGMTPAAFMDVLEDAERIEEVSYRASGRSWFVLSGYSVDGDTGEKLIFYTKVMFSSDRSRLSAFEIVYPAHEKRRYDRIVTRMEKSLTAPL